SAFSLEERAVKKLGDMEEEARRHQHSAKLVKEENRAKSAYRIGDVLRPQRIAESQRHPGRCQPKECHDDQAMKVTLSQRKPEVIRRGRLVGIHISTARHLDHCGHPDREAAELWFLVDHERTSHNSVCSPKNANTDSNRRFIPSAA